MDALIALILKLGILLLQLVQRLLRAHQLLLGYLLSLLTHAQFTLELLKLLGNISATTRVLRIEALGVHFFYFL